MLGEHIKTVSVEVPVSLDTNEGEDGTPACRTRNPLKIHIDYDLIQIVGQALHLRSFCMTNACRPSFFALFCLLPFSTSIQNLDLALDTSHMPGESLDSVPHNLNRLQNLRSLKLFCYDDWPTSSTPGLCLPKLENFTWESDYNNGGASVLYLDRCDMKNLESLRIMVWCSKTFLPEGFLSISRFVGSLLQLRSLALRLGYDDSFTPTLLPLIPSHITELNYVYTFCDKDTVALFPPSVHTLRLSATPSGDQYFLWDVLEYLAIEHTYLRTIIIYIWNYPRGAAPFFWTEGLQAMKNPGDATAYLAVFTGQLLTHSSALSHKGIKLLDEQGHTAFMYLSVA
jgi:hypothetical protein